MKLVPREVDKLGLHNAGFLAQKRLARGLRLNYTEAVALIATQVSFYLSSGLNFQTFFRSKKKKDKIRMGSSNLCFLFPRCPHRF